MFPQVAAAQINSVPISITSTESGPQEKIMASLDIIAHRLQSLLTRTNLIPDDRNKINTQLADFIERLSQIRQNKTANKPNYEKLLL